MIGGTISTLIFLVFSFCRLGWGLREDMDEREAVGGNAYGSVFSPVRLLDWADDDPMIL